jgi:hypothetical protein
MAGARVKTKQEMRWGAQWNKTKPETRGQKTAHVSGAGFRLFCAGRWADVSSESGKKVLNRTAETKVCCGSWQRMTLVR